MYQQCMRGVLGVYEGLRVGFLGTRGMRARASLPAARQGRRRETTTRYSTTEWSTTARVMGRPVPPPLGRGTSGRCWNGRGSTTARGMRRTL